MISTHKLLTNLGAVILLLTLALITFFSYRALQSLTASNARQQVSQRAIFHNQEVASLSKDMVLSMRGYVITGDSAFLAPLQDAATRIRTHAAALSSDARPELRPRVVALITRTRQLQTLVLHTAELRRNLGFETARRYVATQQTKRMMDSIRLQSRRIQITQTSFLEREQAEQEASLRYLSTWLYVLLLTVGVLLIVAFWLLRKDINGRIQAEQKLQGFNRLLETKVEARTRDLQQAFEDTEIKVKFRNMELEKENQRLRETLDRPT